MLDKLLANFSELRQVLITVPAYAALIFLEMFLTNGQQKKAYSWRDTFTNLYLTLLNMAVDAAMRLVTLFCLNYTFDHFRLFVIEDRIVYWGSLIVLEDFCFYIIHRLEHSSRFFWAAHVTHHSSEYFNLSVGFRSSVFQPVYRFVFFLPLSVFGFSPLDFFVVFSATQIYGLLVHTQYIRRIPVYDWIFVAPSHHRVHHASNVRYLDKNLGMFLIIWDRMFGTFVPESKAEAVVYGLHKIADNKGPVKVVFHEWISIWQDWKAKKGLPFRVRVKYLFKAPGWSHDGSTKTAAQYRKELGLK